MSALSTFERSVLEALVRGDDPLLAVLSEQLCRAEVLDRTFTPAGCFVDLALPPNVPLTSKHDFHVGDVHLELEECDHGAAAILFVHQGLMSFLELVAYVGEWPGNPTLRSIRYLSSGDLREERDLTEFRRQAFANELAFRSGLT